MFKHEDDRRCLIEWGDGAWKVSKAVLAKTECCLGNHLHKNKDERFLLFHGKARFIRIGDEVMRDVEAPAEFSVPRGKWHEFWLTEGSILLGLASEPFDPADDFKI
jgi:hypothetical protein